MTEPTNQAVFLQQVQDAAEQLWLMSAWDYDRKLADDGWITVYAVDADVFGTYGSPSFTAQRKDGRLGYGQVFFEDSLELSTALTERLADHIFFKLQDAPLLVIPPIDSEVRTMLEVLTSSLGREPDKATIDEDAIRESICKVTSLSEGEIPPDVLGRFVSLIALQGSRQQQEYMRLTHLLTLERVLSAYNIENDQRYPEDLRALIRIPTSLLDVYEHTIRSNKWRDLLLPTEDDDTISGHRRIALIRDAQAMARLELWNEKLSEKKIRIVYITGARHVIQAAERRKVREFNFFQEYIRHPR